LVQELDLQDQIRFLGYVAYEELPGLYQAAGWFVFPSCYEGFGLPLLEATAAGLPVAAADNSSLPEVMLGQGLFFNCRDIVAMAKALGQLLKKKKNNHQVRALFKKQQDLFSWEKTGRRLAQKIRQLKGAKGRYD
jgi:glycosyltransferase involved in cell wall biosynthesis